MLEEYHFMASQGADSLSVLISQHYAGQQLSLPLKQTSGGRALQETCSHPLALRPRFNRLKAGFARAGLLNISPCSIASQLLVAR